VPLLTTNSLVLLSLIKVLLSLKTIVPIVVNTSLPTRRLSYTVTGKKQVKRNIFVDHILLQTLSCF